MHTHSPLRSIGTESQGCRQIKGSTPWGQMPQNPGGRSGAVAMSLILRTRSSIFCCSSAHERGGAVDSVRDRSLSKRQPAAPHGDQSASHLGEYPSEIRLTSEGTSDDQDGGTRIPADGGRTIPSPVPPHFPPQPQPPTLPDPQPPDFFIPEG